MDRNVRIRFFTIETIRGGEVSFSDAIRRVADMDLADREREIEPEVIFRMERLNVRQNLIFGEMVRLQTENLPPAAPHGQPLARLGVESIGHSSAFAYDPHLSILALQLARNGVTAMRMASYVALLLNLPGYQTLPVPTEEGWAKLQQGNVRAVRVRVANPMNLEAVEARHQTVKSGLAAMKAAAGTGYIDATFGMGRGDPDMDRGNVLSFIRWLWSEKEEDRGGVSKIDARVGSEDGGAAEWLNLLNYHMGGNRVLDLPADDPDRNYGIRENYIRSVFNEHEAALARLFRRADA